MIELIVSIAILGILALFLVPSFLGYTEDAKKSVCEGNRHLIERSFAFYRIMNEEKTISDYINTDGSEHQNTKCPSGGNYTYDDAAGKVLCSIHNTGEDAGESDDSEKDPDKQTGKIPGTDLDVNYETVLSVTEGQSLNKTFQPGTIIEMKDDTGKIIDYYIVKDPTWYGNINADQFGLIKLTDEKAIIVQGTGEAALKEALGGLRSAGIKILYDGKYYISRQTIDNYQPGSTNYCWLEIK